MKPIIVDMKDMSDTTEVYEARPNPFFIRFIYLLVLLLATALLWMWYSKLDIVVKGNGMFRSENVGKDISCNVSGKVEECYISEGQQVKEGEILFTINGDSLTETIKDCEEMLADTTERMEMMEIYEQWLSGEKEDIQEGNKNKYYQEFANRKELLETSMLSATENTGSQEKQYQTEKENIHRSITEYETQVVKLEQTMACIRQRNNIFTDADSYYSSIVKSYISNYEVTGLSYDNQIKGYEKNIESLKEQKKEVKGNKEISKEQRKESLEKIAEDIEKYEENMKQINLEKEKALSNLELQQLATLEQQKASLKETISSLSSNQNSVQAQLDTLKETGKDTQKEVSRLSEREQILAELVSCENKKREYENTLTQYKMQQKNGCVLATADGYISMKQELKTGTYVTEGSVICQILPEETESFYAEVYVENADIGRMKEGQQVKFEISAYPSGEFGYITGTVESIARDIRIDQSTGSAYYLVKAKCDTTTVTDRKGQTGSIRNGMACQAKVVVGRESVLRYLLEKIDLVD